MITYVNNIIQFLNEDADINNFIDVRKRTFGSRIYIYDGNKLPNSVKLDKYPIDNPIYIFNNGVIEYKQLVKCFDTWFNDGCVLNVVADISIKLPPTSLIKKNEKLTLSNFDEEENIALVINKEKKEYFCSLNDLLDSSGLEIDDIINNNKKDIILLKDLSIDRTSSNVDKFSEFINGDVSEFYIRKIYLNNRNDYNPHNIHLDIEVADTELNRKIGVVGTIYKINLNQIDEIFVISEPSNIIKKQYNFTIIKS